MSIRLDERRYVEELKWLVADFRMWKNPLVPLPDGFEDDLAWRSYRVFGQTSPADIIALAVRTRDEDLVAQGEGFISDSVSMKSSGGRTAEHSSRGKSAARRTTRRTPSATSVIM